MRFHLVDMIPDARLHHGLFGYREVIETLAWGLTALGHEVSAQTNFIRGDATNIIFGIQMLSETLVANLAPDTIVYNLEQLVDFPFQEAFPAVQIAARRLRIWEYSERNMEVWRSQGGSQEPVHVPVGWAPVLARIPKRPQEEIDVLFYGIPSAHRFAILGQLCEMSVRCVFACGLYGAERDELIGRARIVLNLNQYPRGRIFEVVRTSYLLANAKAVVADVYPETFVEEDLRPALALAPPDQVCDTCLRLLQDEPARRQLEQRGPAIMQGRDIRAILRNALR